MGLKDLFFGESPDSEITPQSVLSQNQHNVLNELLGHFSQFPTGTGPGTTPFPGQLTSELSDLERFSLEGLENRAQLLAQGDADVLNQGRTSLIEMLTAQPGDIDDFFKTNVQEPILEAFEENIDSLGRRFSKNFFGTGRVDSEREAFEDMMSSLTRERSNLSYKNQQDTLNRRLQALGLVPEIAGAETNELTSLLAGGAVPRGVEEGNIQNLYQEFIRQQQARNEDIANRLATVGVPTFENIATVTEGSPGLLAGFVGGGGIGDILKFIK